MPMLLTRGLGGPAGGLLTRGLGVPPALVTVGADASAAWNTQALAGLDGGATWDVRAIAGAERAARWNVQVLAGTEAGATWQVRALAGADSESQWSLRTLVGRDALASWNTRTLAGADASATWDVESPAVLVTVGRDALATWQVRGLAGQDATAAWQARTLAGSDALAAWDVRSLAGVDAAASWDVLDNVIEADSLLAAIVNRVRDTAAIIDNLPGGFFAVQAPPAAVDNPPFGVLAQVGTRDRWNTSGRIGYDAFLQVSLFGDGDQIHQVLRPAFLDAFGPFMDPLLVAGERFQGCFATGDHIAPDVGQDPLGEPVFHQVLTFTVNMGLDR